MVSRSHLDSTESNPEASQTRKIVSPRQDHKWPWPVLANAMSQAQTSQEKYARISLDTGFELVGSENWYGS